MADPKSFLTLPDRVLILIADFQTRQGQSPSQAEIATALGHSSRGSTMRALARLEADGRLVRHRSNLAITEIGAEWLAAYEAGELEGRRPAAFKAAAIGKRIQIEIEATDTDGAVTEIVFEISRQEAVRLIHILATVVEPEGGDDGPG